MVPLETGGPGSGPHQACPAMGRLGDPNASQLDRTIQALHSIGLVYRRFFTLSMATGGEPMAGLPKTAILVLKHLSHQGPTSPSDLASSLGMARPNVAQILSQLQEQGLVLRHHEAQDKRRSTIHLSPEGTKALQEFFEQHRGSMKSLLSKLGDAELVALEESALNMEAIMATLLMDTR